MTSKQRAFLRAKANTIAPIFQVGKDSVTPELTSSVSDALTARELIKISVLKNCMDEPRDVASALAERTRSEVIQVMGRKITLFKPDPKNTRYPLP